MKPAALALCALAAASALHADAVSDRQKELRRLQDKITEKNRERRQAGERARELEDEVTRISRELRSSQRAMKDMDEKLRDTEKRRADAENRLWASRLDLRQWRRTLSDDMALFYKRRAAAASGRFVEMAWRRRLLSDKAAVVSGAVEKHAEIKASHDELAALKAETQSLKAQREVEADRVREARKEMTGLLTTVQGRRAVLEEEIGELKASAKRFESLIADLIRDRERRAAEQAARQEKHKSVASSARRKPRKAAADMPDFGQLPWPIAGSVVERFGKFKHPELDTVVVSNGIKIRPPQPGPVRAVAAGEVLFAGEFKGYGLMALVAHPDNLFTIYAHLGELGVKKDQKVSVGESLGRSGSAADDRALYFELRLHGEAMDPLLWLK